jgi:actin beta/gamma 1
MSLYASGVTGGIVVDSGETTTIVMPVFQCFTMPYYSTHLDLGGKHLNDTLKRGLAQAGYHFSPSIERELVPDMKEQLCFVSEDVSQQQAIPDRLFMAPDGGGEIKINKEAYLTPEILFHPENIGNDHQGIIDMLCTVISRVDADIREEICRSIVLAGGSTMFAGFPERVEKDLSEKLPNTEFHVMAPASRRISAWVGGSIIASVETFDQLWISRHEYEESGTAIFAERSY